MKQPYADKRPITTTIDMVDQDIHQPQKMNWWYRIAAPPLPTDSASFQKREAYRRGKLISLALFLQLLIVLVLLPTLGLFVNHALIPNLLVMVVLLCVAIALNRRGLVIPAGILAVLGLDLSLMLDLASYPTMSAFLLPMLDLLVLPELFSVSLLPPVAVFFDALFHVCFIVASLTFLFPQDAALKTLLHTASLQDALARPIVLQILVAVITFLWVKSATQAIERADRATSIAMLEREMAEQGVRVAEEKQKLEHTIRQIVAVHTRVANGDYSARVPLAQDNALWEVAGALNNLLSRFQRARETLLLQEKTMAALGLFFHERNRSRNGMIPWTPTQTPVDTLVQQHNGYTQSAPQQSLSSSIHMRPDTH